MFFIELEFSQDWKKDELIKKENILLLRFGTLGYMHFMCNVLTFEHSIFVFEHRNCVRHVCLEKRKCVVMFVLKHRKCVKTCL